MDSDLPPCNGCGGALSLLAGQTVTFSVSLTLEYDEETVTDEKYGAWCADCIDHWNSRLAGGSV